MRCVLIFVVALMVFVGGGSLLAQQLQRYKIAVEPAEIEVVPVQRTIILRRKLVQPLEIEEQPPAEREIQEVEVGAPAEEVPPAEEVEMAEEVEAEEVVEDVTEEVVGEVPELAPEPVAEAEAEEGEPAPGCTGKPVLFGIRRGGEAGVEEVYSGPAEMEYGGEDAPAAGEVAEGEVAEAGVAEAGVAGETCEESNVCEGPMPDDTYNCCVEGRLLRGCREIPDGFECPEG